MRAQLADSRSKERCVIPLESKSQLTIAANILSLIINDKLSYVKRCKR